MSSKNAQMMIRIKTKTMARAESRAKKVKEALISLGDERKNGAWCKQNGGGTLKNEATGFIDYIMYFDLIYRSDI